MTVIRLTCLAFLIIILFTPICNLSRGYVKIQTEGKIAFLLLITSVSITEYDNAVLSNLLVQFLLQSYLLGIILYKIYSIFRAQAVISFKSNISSSDSD